MDNQPVIRAAIQSAVSKGIRDIRRDPNRSIRRLVDLGIQFGKGQYQQTFFSDAQLALRNRHSAYYPLVTSLIRNVDAKTLETFGLNIGYMSWTMGAKAIRTYEKEHGVNVPWTIILRLDQPTQTPLRLASLVEQGQALGIYTYFVYISSQTANPSALLSTMEQQTNSAFFVLSADVETNLWMAGQNTLPPNTLMVPLCDSEGETQVGDAFAKLRRLFGFCCVYDANNADQLLSDVFMERMVAQGCPILFYLPAPGCDPETIHRVYTSLLALRGAGRHPLFPIALPEDIRQVDHIISNEQCMLELGADGTVLRPEGSASLSVEQLSLEALIGQTMPRVRHHR